MNEMVERFWAKVEIRSENECWLWTATTQTIRCGISYGYFRAGRMVRAHRLAWEIANGTKIPVGLVVRHKCDNGLCCNPSHLELGTQQDNVQDRYNRGRSRHALGSAHGWSKLKEEDIPKIRALLREGNGRRGMGQRVIGKRFGVSQYAIREILHGKTWKHV